MAQQLLPLPLLLLLLPLGGALVVTAPAAIKGLRVAAQPADFGFEMDASAVRGPLRQPLDAWACTVLAHGSMQGQVALVRRGKCTFHLKAVNLLAAGASAMVVMNNVDGPLFSMTDDSQTPVQQPSMLISKADGEMLLGHIKETAAASGELVEVALSLVCQTFYSDGVVHSCSSNHLADKLVD
jgi:hypothetical protein|eukprot:COSAG01_NODE_2999_length_6737_cov_54.759114_7_plen_183_part_00